MLYNHIFIELVIVSYLVLVLWTGRRLEVMRVWRGIARYSSASSNSSSISPFSPHLHYRLCLWRFYQQNSGKHYVQKGSPSHSYHPPQSSAHHPLQLLHPLPISEVCPFAFMSCSCVAYL